MKTVNILLLGLGLAMLSACTAEQMPAEATDTSGDPNMVNVFAQWPPEQFLPASDAPSVDTNVYRRNYVLAIDTSGSMDSGCDGEDKITSAKQSAENFVKRIPVDSAIGLVVFGGSAQVVVPLSTNNHAEVQTAIRSLQANGGTPMSEALNRSYQELVTAGGQQYGYGHYDLVVLGDGQPDSSHVVGETLDRIARQTPISVTTIGFCADLDVLDRVGVNFMTANNSAELAAAFETVLAETSDYTESAF